MLTALEAFLVSLYGFRPTDDPPAQQPLNSETSSTPSEAGQPEKDNSLASTDLLKDRPAARTDASNSSSSSSLAEDWVVSYIPAALESNSSLDGQSCSLSAETNWVNELPERPEDHVLSSDKSREQFSAEDWSRGTALSDPVSGMPLQPVSIHPPLKIHHSSPPSPSNKKMLNAITEKRAALTAYDLISKRALRAPLSPAAMFEKEARAEVLREKPAASLQDISAAVHQRWKNLREEDRKK